MAMELYELQVSTSNIHNKLNELGNSLQKETKQNRIEEIVKMMEDPSFWLDRHLSSSLIKEMNSFPNVGKMFFTACGITIFIIVVPKLRPTERPPSICPISTD